MVRAETKIKNKNVIFLIFFLYLFGPVFNSISPIVDFIFFVSVALCARGIPVKLFLVKAYTVFSLLFVVAFYSVIAISFFDDSSFSDFLQMGLSPVRTFMTIMAGFCLVRLCFEKGYSEQKIITYAFYAAAAHATIMVLQLVFPEFKEAIYTYTTNFSQVGYENYLYEYHFRMGGLSGGTGSAILSVSMAIPILLMPLVLQDQRFARKLLIHIMAFLIVSSVLISGRSGLMVLILFTPIAIYLNANLRSKVYGILAVFNFFFLLIVAIIGLLTVLAMLDNESDIYYAMARTMETLVNFEKGEYSDNTVNALSRHIMFPDSLSTWLLGDGLNLVKTQFDRVLKSDIGVIRNIWSLGVVVSLIYWFPYLYLLFISMRKLKTRAGINLFLIVSVTILFQFKEDILYSRILCSFLGLVLAVFYFRTNGCPNKYVNQEQSK